MKPIIKEYPELWSTWIGKQVHKKSRKPFKSGAQVGTVSGSTTHPVTGRMCFTFIEDSSYVECFRCRLVENQT